MKRSLGPKTVLFPTPVWCVGSYDTEERPNLMTAAWAGICCSSPPCLAVSLRKATYTYGNIVERGAFTVNVPSASYAKEADAAGIISGRKEDKFSILGLTPIRGEYVDAPYVGEFPLTAECRLIQKVELGLHTMFIGEIVDIKVDEACLNEKGIPDPKKVNPMIFAPEFLGYFELGEPLGRAFKIGKNLQEKRG